MVIPLLLYLLLMSSGEHTQSREQDSKRKASSGSWITERDALREFADRKTRAILAIFTSRRSSGKKEFFVPPHIAELYRLTPRDLAWAYEKLEGLFINTVNSKMGKFRIVRLTDEWEARESQKTKVSKQVVSNKDSDEERVTIDRETIKLAALQSSHAMDPGVEDTLRQLVAES